MRGSGGPCDHCGRTQSPCWRKGPPEKNTLCNACGARWLVKRSLENYQPSCIVPGPRVAYAAKQPRSKPRKPRSSVSKAAKLSPAAAAAYTHQLTIMTKLEQHGMRLVAGAALPLFQTAGHNQGPSLLDQKPIGLASRGVPPNAAPGAPQLCFLPGVNIQVKEYSPVPAAKLGFDGGASLRRRARKQAHVTRAAT